MSWPSVAVEATVNYEFIPDNEEWEATMWPTIRRREGPYAPVTREQHGDTDNGEGETFNSYCGTLEGIHEAINSDLLSLKREL